MVILPRYPLFRQDNGESLFIDAFNSIRQMKRILLGNIPVVSRIDQQAMEEIQEYLSPGNEAEVVTELIERHFAWIIKMGSNISYIFHGVNTVNSSWAKRDTSFQDWRANPRVPEFIADVCYEFFQLLLRNPEAHRNAKTCNHLFCSFWPYAVWAYKQILDKNLEERPEWNSDLERVTKTIWSSYAPLTYKTSRNADDFKSQFAFSSEDSRYDRVINHIGANQILDKFRKIAFSAMARTNTPMPGVSILYYKLDSTSQDTCSSLIPIEESPMSVDDQLLMKAEVASNMWQAETSLLSPMGIYENNVESLSYLDMVCQGFFK